MRRENNRWLGWKRITQNMRYKMAAGAVRRARKISFWRAYHWQSLKRLITLEIFSICASSLAERLSLACINSAQKDWQRFRISSRQWATCTDRHTPTKKDNERNTVNFWLGLALKQSERQLGTFPELPAASRLVNNNNNNNNNNK